MLSKPGVSVFCGLAFVLIASKKCSFGGYAYHDWAY
jgi:hypothetical protein